MAQFEAELHGAVMRRRWNTYVTVHTIKAAVRRQTVLCNYDHGQLMDEATAKMLADKGIWLSTQPFLEDEDATPFESDPGRRPSGGKVALPHRYQHRLWLAKKYQTEDGTDVIFDAKKPWRRARLVAKMKTLVHALDPKIGDRRHQCSDCSLQDRAPPIPANWVVIEAGRSCRPAYWLRATTSVLSTWSTETGGACQG